MVVDQRTLRANMLRNNIGANVFNKLTGQQAQTPAQQPVQQTQTTPTIQPTQNNDTITVKTTKFPTYDIKDLMGAGGFKNQISLMQNVAQYNKLQQQAQANTNPNIRYDFNKPQITNKPTLELNQGLQPEVNDQGLKINKTASFSDLIADLSNVASQGRNLEFAKFRDLYPEYVQNRSTVVDIFNDIKNGNTQDLENKYQKSNPEMFGVGDNFSNSDRTQALQRLYTDILNNKESGTKIDTETLTSKYPEFANTQDANTIKEMENLLFNSENTPTINDIATIYPDLLKGEVEIGNAEKKTMKDDISKIENMSQSTYNHLSDEGKKYVEYLSTAEAVKQALGDQYYVGDKSGVEIAESLKNSDPELYKQIFGDVNISNLSEEDRKLLDEGYTIGAINSMRQQIKHSATEGLAGLGRKLQERAGTERKGERNPQPVRGQREDGTYEFNPLLKEDGTYETNPIKIREIKMAGNNYQQRVRTQEYRGKNPGMDKLDFKLGELLFGLGEEMQRAGEKGMEKIESSQSWKDVAELNKTSFWDALKKGDVKTMLSKSTAAIGQSAIPLVVGYATGNPVATFGAMYPGSYERAMQDIEADENLKDMTQEEKERAARLMATTESAIEEISLSMVAPKMFGDKSILDMIGGESFKKLMNNAIIKGITQTELGAASEGGEEVLQELFNNLITQSYGSDRELGDLQDYRNIFSETFLSSQLLSAMGGTMEGVDQARQNQIENQIKEQGELRNTVLEGQAIMADNFNDFASAVEQVPGTTTEELQQVWNNAQQKKQELEQKANMITSNSYNNVTTPTYERATIKDTVKPKITANESQQYTDLLDEMVKNKEISEEDRKRVEKTLGVFTLNTKEEQDNKIGQQQQPSGLANINQSNNTNTEEKSNIISRSQNQLVQNYNRMNPKAINDFKKQFKQDYGQFLIDRGFTKAGEDNLDDLVQYADTLLNLKDKALEPMQGRYQDRSLEDMLEMVVDRARNTKDYKKIEEYDKLLQKYNEGGIEVSEILAMMRWFNNSIKTGFFKEQNSEKLELATNVYMATRNFLDKTAKENGFDSLDKINREIRAVEHIIGGVTYKMQGSSANNMLGLNDYISLGAVIANPDAFAFAVTKLALKNENIRNLVLRLAVGKRGNSKNRITESKLNDELNRINAIADQKARDAAVKDFNEKYGIDKKALPYKEGYNGTPTTTITVTPEGLSKTQGKVNTPNNEQKSQGLSETEKKSEPQDNVNEQVQDSIDDFLSDVGANETKQDLEDATTANYKNMSKRGLEQLLKSDRIPAEEAKKITDELAMRNAKEDKDGWDYLDHKYAYEIQQLQEEEQRIGKVGNKKVNKTYAEEQMKTWETKKEKLKEDMKQAYGDKDNDRVEDKYSELEGKSIDYVNEWKKSKRFAVDEAEQQVIAKLQENWNKIKRFELNMTEEEKKVREDILGKVSDLYETKSTDYGDSFVSRTNRDNRGIIYRDDGRVNVNSLDTLKSSGLYDVLPDDTKIAISGQEQTTLGELKNTKPENNGLANINVDKEAEAQVEGLAKINEQLAKEEQNKKTTEEGEQATLKEKAEAQKIIDNEIADEQNDIVKEIDQKALNDMEFSIQELDDIEEGYNAIEQEQLGLAKISENEVKEEVKNDEKEVQAKIARDRYRMWTKGTTKDEKIAYLEEQISASEWNIKYAKNDAMLSKMIDKMQMQHDEMVSILEKLKGKKKQGLAKITETEVNNNIAKEIKVENGKIETVKSDSDMINEIKDDVITNMKKPRQKSILGKPLYYQYLQRNGEIEINKTQGSQFGNYYNIILKDPSGLKASYILAENDGNWTIRKIGKQDLAGEDLKQFYDTYFGKATNKEVESQKVEVAGNVNDPIREFKRNNQDNEQVDEILNKETTWTDYDTGIKYKGTKAQEIQQKVDKLMESGKVTFRNDSYGKTMSSFGTTRFLSNDTELNYARFLYDNPQIRQEGPKAKGLKEAIEEKKNSIVEEQKKVATEGTKDINPDKVLWQQNTYKEGVDKVYGVLKQTFDDFLQVAFYSDFLKNNPTTQEMVDYRTSNGERIGVVKARIADVMYNKLGFKSNKSKEFVDLNTNIAETKGNEAKLRAIANTLYIDRVRKDIKEGYNYPQEVINAVPGLRTAQDNYERYLKGRDTSFSSKDARIDYSEQDILGAGTKRQDGKQITEAQRKEIVDGVTEYQEVMGIDMKKMAEDIGLVYVHLNGKHPFLTARAVGVFHPGYNSISVGAGRENYREKDGKNMTTHTADIVMAHEITHAIDSIFDWNLFSEELIDSIRHKMTNYKHAGAYWKSKEEVTARMVEEYVSVMKGSEGYFDMNYYWNKEDFENYVKPAVEKIFNEKFADYKIDKTKAPTKVGGKDIAEIKADAITRGLAEISNF